MGDDLVMDLDLNLEPFVDPSPPSPPAPPSLGLGSFLDQLETSRGGIEDRIRQLEAVTARARQRQRWRRTLNNPELSYMSIIESTVGVSYDSQGENRLGMGVVEGPLNGGGDVEGRVGAERVRNCKRDISQLAKALEMDLDEKKTDNGGAADNGNFFDCNICLDMARDPILTCCGHLFCWGCFYQVPYVDSIAKECPVCKGEVNDSNITPIYGNGNNSPALELESRVKIPPRPQAKRVEGVRQQGFSRGIAHIPVADALRRIRIGLGLDEENPPPLGVNSVRPTSEINPLVLHNSEASREARQFSRVTSESAASLSSISSALNSAERFVEDLETYINDRHMRTDAQPRPAYQERDTSVANTTAIQSDPLTGEIDRAMPFSLSSQRNLATPILHWDALATANTVEIDLTIPPPASSRRRRVVSRALNLDGEASLELRRRRLR